MPADCPVAVAALMAQCWDGNPSVRPSFENIKQALEDGLD